MPETLIIGLIIAVIIGVLFIPFRLPARKRPKRKRYLGGLGPALSAINEIFNPSAQQASIILEEKKIARKATPAPEDPFDKNPESDKFEK